MWVMPAGRVLAACRDERFPTRSFGHRSGQETSKPKHLADSGNSGCWSDYRHFGKDAADFIVGQKPASVLIVFHSIAFRDLNAIQQ
jgi:hypothetical protein